MRFTLFTSLIVLAGCASAPQPQTPAAPKNAPCADCVPTDHHFTILIQDNTSTRFIVRGTVGDQPRKFILDTGAVHSEIATDEKTKAFSAEGQTRVSGFDQPTRTCDRVRLSSFLFNGWHYTHVPIARCENGLGDLLGLDFMKHPTLDLNFEHLTISTKKKVDQKAKMIAMKRDSEGLIHVPLKVANESVWALFDTGRGTTVIDKNFIEAHPNAFRPFTVDVNGETQVVSTHDGELYTATDIVIEGVPHSAQLVVAVPFSKELKDKIQGNMILGANSIMTANWFFDLEHGQFSVSGFSKNAPVSKMSDIQATGKRVTRADPDYISIDGEAKVSGGDNWLTGTSILIDVKEKTARCESDCVFAQGQNRYYNAPVVIDMKKEIWEQVLTER